MPEFLRRAGNEGFSATEILIPALSESPEPTRELHAAAGPRQREPRLPGIAGDLPNRLPIVGDGTQISVHACTKQQVMMERNPLQVVYVFRTDHSKELGRKNGCEILSLRNGGAILQGRQDKDETENRSCTYAFTRAHFSWRHLDKVATGPNGATHTST